MKLLVNLDDGLFNEVIRLTRAKTKKEAIVISLTEYINNRRKKELLNLIGGAYKHGMTLQQLLKVRKAWKKS